MSPSTWKPAANPRPIEQRVVLGALLRLDSPCHVGGADADATTDRALLRDATGRPYLPGTSLKGVLRGRAEPRWRARVFGSDAEAESACQAGLIVDDAPLVGTPTTELRDGVAIDPSTAIASDQKRYDLELLPEGTQFLLSFELVVPKGDAHAWLGVALDALAPLESGIELGARSTHGFGGARIAGGWTVRRFEVSAPAGIRAWLRGEVPPEHRWSEVSDLSTVARHLGCSLGEAPPRRAAYQIDLDLELTGSILIRAGCQAAGPADSQHLSDPAGAPIVSGTTLAGVLRKRCLRIASTIGGSERSAALVDELFGPWQIRGRARARRSRVVVPQVRIEGGCTLRHTRVQIDPWTGGAAESLLFTVEPHYEGRVSGSIRFTEEDPGGLALALLALRDLATGDLPVGGEGGTGRGTFRAPPDRPCIRVGPRSIRIVRNDAGGTRVEIAGGSFDEEMAALRGRLAGGSR